MDEQVINLVEGDKSLMFWSGRKNGRDVYEKQVSKKITQGDLENGFTIVFPASIEYVNYSFVQGFFSSLSTNLDKNKIKKVVQIRSDQEGFADLVWEKFLNNPLDEV